MQTKQLGSSDLQITSVGYGAWAIGGSGWQFAEGEQNDADSIAASDFNEPNLSRNLALVERLRAIGKRHERSPGEVAIAWTLLNPAVTGAIVGARNAGQAEGVMRAGELPLTKEEVSEIEASLGTVAA
jgi:aryl-alcohol dehydrogenase-like predicted oxidoreductase